MKMCPRCCQTQPRDQFYRSSASKDGLYAYCKACHRDKKRARSEDQRRGQYLINRACLRRQRTEIAAIKASRGCLQCGERHPACLDFHHRDPGDKLFEIGSNHYRAAALLSAEIDKCDVLCANCHRKLHWSDPS
jgi:hypothetical protein